MAAELRELKMSVPDVEKEFFASKMPASKMVELSNLIALRKVGDGVEYSDTEKALRELLDGVVDIVSPSRLVSSYIGWSEVDDQVVKYLDKVISVADRYFDVDSKGLDSIKEILGDEKAEQQRLKMTADYESTKEVLTRKKEGLDEVGSVLDIFTFTTVDVSSLTEAIPLGAALISVEGVFVLLSPEKALKVLLWKDVWDSYELESKFREAHKTVMGKEASENMMKSYKGWTDYHYGLAMVNELRRNKSLFGEGEKVNQLKAFMDVYTTELEKLGSTAISKLESGRPEGYSHFIMNPDLAPVINQVMGDVFENLFQGSALNIVMFPKLAWSITLAARLYAELRTGEIIKSLSEEDKALLDDVTSLSNLQGSGKESDVTALMMDTMLNLKKEDREVTLSTGEKVTIEACQQAAALIRNGFSVGIMNSGEVAVQSMLDMVGMSAPMLALMKESGEDVGEKAVYMANALFPNAGKALDVYNTILGSGENVISPDDLLSYDPISQYAMLLFSVSFPEWRDMSEDMRNKLAALAWYNFTSRGSSMNAEELLGDAGLDALKGDVARYIERMTGSHKGSEAQVSMYKTIDAVRDHAAAMLLAGIPKDKLREVSVDQLVSDAVSPVQELLGKHLDGLTNEAKGYLTLAKKLSSKADGGRRVTARGVVATDGAEPRMDDVRGAVKEFDSTSKSLRKSAIVLWDGLDKTVLRRTLLAIFPNKKGTK